MVYYHIKESVKSQLYTPLKWLLNHQPEEAISLFCDPRSGSTWLAEILLKIEGSGFLSEPLNINKVSELRKLNFGWRQYIPEDENWKEAYRFFEQLLKGKILNYSVSPPENIWNLIQSEKLIIKYVRGKGLLPWYVKQFNFKYQPIFLIRHPMAVVASQLKHRGWSYKYTGFEIPISPHNEIYLRHEDFLSKLKTKEEGLIALWCITNLIPINHQDHDKAWIAVHYENLLLQPKTELDRIFKRWRLPMPDNILSDIDKPSANALNPSAPIPKSIILNKWKKELSLQQQKRMFKVLEYFNFPFYGEGIMPSKTRGHQ